MSAPRTSPTNEFAEIARLEDALAEHRALAHAVYIAVPWLEHAVKLARRRGAWTGIASNEIRSLEAVLTALNEIES